ncbi:L-threonylcarbamoyladenylate synthase [Altericroceibacterium endophyticum]|uniref:Threonylcarbamoyl-AMP synthase n=1 Tax=Altericroceibacterium endophyticum TaxID=1808508 RepID=A0A6I4T6N5_9SPHN|nr:L-threonylcarbamoyladenylate synthase [Altericroceibacterium endophyticum]MXO65663.1 threonylcarbamoyl-AMP synthase [Altericroceibacterium endophyticum]
MSGKQIATIIKPDAHGLERAVARLEQGGLVAVPTETVYGLAARADNAAAVAGIYRAKGRPDFNPLITHIHSLAQAEHYAVLDERAHLLAEHFWPGPLTMVLPRREGAGLAPAVMAGLPTIALRMPRHRVMRALLKSVPFPLAAPSANRSGGVSPTSVDHVANSLGNAVDIILDGGSCEAGLESTIVALRPEGEWSLLRPGPLDRAQLANLLGRAEMTDKRGIEAPGQLASHYAPGKPVRLNATHAKDNEVMIGFGPIPGRWSLSEEGDLMEAAFRLYDCLHLAAAAEESAIAIAPLPEIGIGQAINDRLRRAAA